MLRRVVLSLVPLVLCAPAHATASLDCAIRDKAVTAEIGAVVSRSIPGLQQLIGTLTTTAKGIPTDLKQVDDLDKHIAYQWLYDRDIRLLFYLEKDEGPFRSLELVIQTSRKKGSDDEYVGTYVLTVSHMPGAEASEPKMLVLKGKATCSLG
jgi:hypothetical protein